ncbi:uridylate-specific endoribonuclease B-like [Corticium candelabrum]|uniref:uridylate-specific endoribonuclease B-like n=1 Tax=Corticium candelabrum TaxID=121492 RepID=UPI002E2754AE|nr:uridylate-specific endoribonuclease B-like [Corticium candelabrum]
MARRGHNLPDEDPELSRLFTQLWRLDKNRLTPGRDYEINLQGGTKRFWTRDHAREPLFTYVTDEALRRPTYRSFIALLDNYERETTVPETVTPEEERENWTFIDAIMETEPMKEAHRFLAGKKKSPSDEQGFKRQLYDIWFKLYRRTRASGCLDSSGFEHVFVGECRGGEGRGRNEVIGFHNWIQYYQQEKCGAVDYKGYILNKEPEGPDTRLLTIQFSWKRETKPEGSTFIGTSPEFEMAIYTVLFLCGQSGDNVVTVDKHRCNIKVYHHGRNLGTAYPIEL